MSNPLLVLPIFMLELEAAELARLQPSTLQNWRVLGTGPPFIRLGGARGRIVYEREALIAWIRSHERTSTSDDVEVVNAE